MCYYSWCIYKCPDNIVNAWPKHKSWGGTRGVLTLKATDRQIEPSECGDEQNGESRGQELPASTTHSQHSLGWKQKTQKTIKKRPEVTSTWGAGIACADSWHWNRTRRRRTWLEKEHNVRRQLILCLFMLPLLLLPRKKTTLHSHYLQSDWLTNHKDTVIQHAETAFGRS